MPPVDIINRIETHIGAKYSLNVSEQLLLDARDSILCLRKQNKNLIDEVISIIENFDPYSPYIVGKMKINERKEELIEQIKELV